MYEELDWINSCLKDGTVICCWLGSRDYLYLYSPIKAFDRLLVDVFRNLTWHHRGFKCQIVPQKITHQGDPLGVNAIILNTPTPHYGGSSKKKACIQDPSFMQYLVTKCPYWIIHADLLLEVSQNVGPNGDGR
jgi:hypothetical protein